MVLIQVIMGAQLPVQRLRANCKYADCSRRKFSDCRDYCPVNCTGVYDSNWSGCTAVCAPSAADNAETIKTGTEYKYWNTHTSK